jgi:hypothetical protein
VPGVIDSHLHLVDFLQHPVDDDALASSLRGPVEGAVVFGLPVKKKWAVSEPERPTYYLDDNAPCGLSSMTDELVASLVAGLPHDLRHLVAPLVCGFDPTDLLGVEHVERMISRHDVWRGVGEVLLRHDDLTELTYGENARAGHPALDPVLELCAGRGWPFLFHQDMSSAGRSGGREYLGEVTSMLARHPRVPQVWAHGGVSRRVHPDDLTSLLGELLDAHPNLHLDLSWVLFDEVVGDDGPPQVWTDLVERHADRFVVGSDAFGDLEQQQRLLARWEPLTDALPRRVRDLVASGNARRLWWGA